MEFLTEVRWSPYVAGVGIGVLSWLSFLISKQPIACSTTFARTSGLVERLVRKTQADNNLYYQEIKLSWGWQGMLVVGVVLGALLSALLSGDFQWQWVPDRWTATFGNNALLRVMVALLGGVALGFGARWSDGCTSGHGISGTLQLAVSSWISAIFFFVGGILTAQFIFHVIG
jgi:uncharacterized membrane protein YedE/YeeE